MNFLSKSIIASLALGLSGMPLALTESRAAGVHGGIKPHAQNPWYWEYQGKPVILLGGGDDAAAFQRTGRRLTDFLDQLVSVGGNYIRNVISDRAEGSVYAFKEVGEGKYDLTQWNDEYWSRLDTFLSETARRGIVVQLTLWDHGDLSVWGSHPWNPVNNVNLAPGSLTNGFGDAFFYYTVTRNNEAALRLQRGFVDKLLSITFRHGNVLYNIQNDAHLSAEWEDYWAGYVRQAARQRGFEAYVTVTKHDPSTAVRHAMSHPDLYNFIDVSQNNQDSRGARGRGHWDNLMFWRQKVAERPSGAMPINNEQVHGSVDGVNYSAGSETEAMNRLWRNIFAGCASSRFHRTSEPRMWGSGLNPRAQTNIRAMRMLLEELDIFSCVPHNDLLTDRVRVSSTMEAYVTANIGQQYAVYFPPGRHTVNLDPWVFAKKVKLRWLDIDNLRWSSPVEMEVEWLDNQHRWGFRGRVPLTTPSNRAYVALIDVVE